jgi:hypothetical protein
MQEDYPTTKKIVKITGVITTQETGNTEMK